MDQGLLPRRYAKALYKFAEEKGRLEDVYTMMNNIDEAFDDNKTLHTVIANPFVDEPQKTSLLVTASGAKSEEDKNILADFVKLLIKNHRIDLMHRIALAYLSLYRKAKNIYRVEIESAAPLSESDNRRLTSMIDSHLGGATAEYSTKVNPDLIGGFVVNIDNERLDASVRNELKQLRLNLLK